MASILKVDTIQDQSGNNIINENADTITIGASGDTITVPTGASLTVPNGGLSGQNYPAFEAYLSSNQSISNNTLTKIQFDTEIFDSDSMYDNSTNYRFTPTTAGKYFVYSCVMVSQSSNQLEKTRNIIFKNGSEYKRLDFDVGGSGTAESIVVTNNAIIDFNGSSDYVEIYALAFTTGTTNIQGSSTYKYNSFGAYRIGD